jgi:hypothetical protein
VSLEAISEGTFLKITLPIWSTFEDLQSSKVLALDLLHGENYNLFATMKLLRERIWAHYTTRPKIAMTVALDLAWNDTAAAVQCFYAIDGITLALGQFARHLRERGSSSKGYVLCRALETNGRLLSFSYCRKVGTEYEQDDFVDHLDRSGLSKRVTHARFGSERKPFINLYGGFDAVHFDECYSQSPEEY